MKPTVPKKIEEQKHPGPGVRGVWHAGPRGQNREIACKNDIDDFTCPNLFLLKAEK